ncbi:MAG: hypothetical protein M3Z97_06515, partial [Candidatus Dormibacteraeota bacterium]|nr:hypothetical protein [Candidatus Dormibacteraeota bacterium]
MKDPAWATGHPALQALLELAAEEARERGHGLVEPAHLVLALTRQDGEAADLIHRAGAEPRIWRDYINYILGVNDGMRQAELGQMRPGHLKDVVQIRHQGALATSDALAALLQDALEIAAGDPVDHRHVLAALFEGHGHIAAGTARFMRLSAEAVREAGRLPGPDLEQLPEYGDAVPIPRGVGRLVLFGSCHIDQPALLEILSPAERQSVEARGALLVDAASPEPEPELAESLSAMLGFEVRDSGIRDRVDASDARAVDRLETAGAILLEGGSVLRLYSTLSGTPVLGALVAASDAGTAVIACSAGAQL